MLAAIRRASGYGPGAIIAPFVSLKAKALDGPVTSHPSHRQKSGLFSPRKGLAEFPPVPSFRQLKASACWEH